MDQKRKIKPVKISWTWCLVEIAQHQWWRNWFSIKVQGQWHICALLASSTPLFTSVTVHRGLSEYILTNWAYITGHKSLMHLPWIYAFKGCDSNFEVKCSNFKSLQMIQLPCIKQYVLWKRLAIVIIVLKCYLITYC